MAREPTCSQQLASFWANARYADLPGDVVHLVKRLILDTLAVSIAAMDTPEGRTVCDAMLHAARDAPSGARLWGTARRLPPAMAAIANGTCAHIAELDDCGGSGHTGAVVVPAAFALAGNRDLTGQDMIVAIAAGADLSTRVLDALGGYASHNADGWHSTATVGSFAAAAAAARVLGLEETAFAHALGVAGTFTGGTWAFAEDGAMTKRYHAGRAAETGVTGALLAQAGMTGPARIFEAEWGGMLTSFARQNARPDRLVHEVGRMIRVEDVLKRHGCCLGLHPLIDEVLKLRSGGLSASDMIAMTVYADWHYRRLFDRPVVNNLLEAQFSTQYCLAVAAVAGAAGWDQFVSLMTGNPDVRWLMRRISIIIAPSGTGKRLELSTRAGAVITRPITDSYGTLTDDELFEKVRDLLVARLGEALCAQLIDRVMNLEKEPVAAAITELLVTPSPAGSCPA